MLDPSVRSWSGSVHGSGLLRDTTLARPTGHHRPSFLSDEIRVGTLDRGWSCRDRLHPERLAPWLAAFRATPLDLTLDG